MRFFIKRESTFIQQNSFSVWKSSYKKKYVCHKGIITGEKPRNTQASASCIYYFSVFCDDNCRHGVRISQYLWLKFERDSQALIQRSTKVFRFSWKISFLWVAGFQNCSTKVFRLLKNFFFVVVSPEKFHFCGLQVLMPAVHSRRMHLARVSGGSCLRQDWESATLYTLAESSQFWRTTRGDSQARHEILWLVHHGPLKKRDLTRRDTSAEATRENPRPVFPSTFSLSPCLRVPLRECAAGIRIRRSIYVFKFWIIA